MTIGITSTQIKTNISSNGEVCTIAVKGNFDFNLVTMFRGAYSNLETIAKKYIVDLRHTDSIDSAALGMLINMKKFLNKKDGEIEIHNCNPTVKRILSIARFDILFQID